MLRARRGAPVCTRVYPPLVNGSALLVPLTRGRFSRPHVPGQTTNVAFTRSVYVCRPDECNLRPQPIPGNQSMRTGMDAHAKATAKSGRARIQFIGSQAGVWGRDGRRCQGLLASMNHRTDRLEERDKPDRRGPYECGAGRSSSRGQRSYTSQRWAIRRTSTSSRPSWIS